MAIHQHWIGSDNLFEVTGAQNVLTGDFLNSATVQVTVVDATTETEVNGETWPLTLSYVAASNGDYRGVLSDQLVLQEQQSLRYDVVVDAGAGLRREWRLFGIAEYANE